MSHKNQEFRDLQQKAALSNTKCADYLGCSRQAIDKWRSGENRTPEPILKLMRSHALCQNI
jgi:DNA-binding transcriptional regulator YiaG